MATLKEKLVRWNSTRSTVQKITDVLFWMILLLLIIPGPRKVIATGMNRAVLHLKHPRMIREEDQVTLSDEDFGWMLYQDPAAPIRLNDLRGKVIFLNIWATWCPPCVAELPEILKAYEKHGGRVAFILVSTEKPEVVESFLVARGYDLPVYYPGTPAPDVFQATALPTTYILSREGRIVVQKKGASNWDSPAMTRLFNGLLR
jgi:thiol-disulfide isomerase/thioredoxin